MSQVSIVKCEDYKQELVDEALHKSLDLIGGLASIVKPGNKVLIKVNALMGVSPGCAATTHPALVKAMVKEVLKAGGIPFVGDSPGNANANVEQVYEGAEIKKPVEEAGGKMIYFEKEGVAEVKSSRGKIYKLAKTVLEADVVINMPKLKTHNLTLYTGAIKNMFGSVLGFNKGEMHYKFPKPDQFSNMLVDIFEITKPELNIMDAIFGMEGHGPSGGHPRKMGAIITSTDGIAMDAVCSYLIGYNPKEITTTKFAAERNLGEINLDKIEIRGEPLESMRQVDWKHTSDAYSILSLVPSFLIWLVRPLAKQIYIKPEIINEKCTKCMVCVKNCPAKCIKMNPVRNYISNGVKEDYPFVNKKECIMCFCCHELCEYKAIKLNRSWLAKKLYIGYEYQD